MAEDYDEDSATLVERIANRIKFGPEFAKALAVLRVNRWLPAMGEALAEAALAPAPR